MSQILIYFFIGISLSIDAFSLAISLGTTIPSKRNIIKTSIIISIFHFIMPLLGSKTGKLLKDIIVIKPNIILFIIFTFLGIEMLKRNKEEQKNIKLTTIMIIIVSLSVSIDSFTVGFAIQLLSNPILPACVIFSILSGLFTYIGFSFGKIIEKVLQEKSNYVGAFIIFIIAIKYLFLK